MDNKASAQQAFEQGFRAQTAGRIQDAQAYYQRAVALFPRHADSLNGLGVLAIQRGAFEEGATWIRKALKIDDRVPHFHYYIAMALSQLGKADQAIHHYRQAVLLQPTFFEAQVNLGAALRATGKIKDAVHHLERAVAINPKHPAGPYNLANALHAAGRLTEAVAQYRAALALQPNLVEAICNLGAVLEELGQDAEAGALYERALVLDPNHVPSLTRLAALLRRQEEPAKALAVLDRLLSIAPHADTWNDRGVLLLGFGRLDDALASFAQALALDPGHVAAQVGRGNALYAREEFAAAIDSYDAALARNPAFVEATSNKGSAQRAIGDITGALVSYDRALALNPRHLPARMNRAQALLQTNQIEQALSDCAAALALNPDEPEAHWITALCELTRGNFARGWEEHEWRTRLTRAEKARYNFREWAGEDIAGRTLLLYAEQGFGDALQFCRYAPLVAAKGARVVLAVPQELVALLKSLAGVAEVVAWGPAPQDIDIQCSVMSLPYRLGTTLETIPAAVPYLSADAASVERWRERLAPVEGLRIGLVWSGRTRKLTERHRAIPPDLLAPLLETGAAFVSLQKDYRDDDRAWLAAHPQVHDLSGELASFADTAAVISLMDAVVSIDTAAAHLAGALGKPLHLALASAADWRWLRDRGDSPWYPTATLYRQTTPGDWPDVIGRIAQALR